MQTGRSVPHSTLAYAPLCLTPAHGGQMSGSCAELYSIISAFLEGIFNTYHIVPASPVTSDSSLANGPLDVNAHVVRYCCGYLHATVLFLFLTLSLCRTGNNRRSDEQEHRECSLTKRVGSQYKQQDFVLHADMA